jgi:hypothetical protein
MSEFCKSIQRILYKTEDGFEAPEAPAQENIVPNEEVF